MVDLLWFAVGMVGYLLIKFAVGFVARLLRARRASTAHPAPSGFEIPVLLDPTLILRDDPLPGDVIDGEVVTQQIERGERKAITNG